MLLLHQCSSLQGAPYREVNQTTTLKAPGLPAPSKPYRGLDSHLPINGSLLQEAEQALDISQIDPRILQAREKIRSVPCPHCHRHASSLCKLVRPCLSFFVLSQLRCATMYKPCLYACMHANGRYCVRGGLLLSAHLFGSAPMAQLASDNGHATGASFGRSIHGPTMMTCMLPGYPFARPAELPCPKHDNAHATSRHNCPEHPCAHMTRSMNRGTICVEASQSFTNASLQNRRIDTLRAANSSTALGLSRGFPASKIRSSQLPRVLALPKSYSRHAFKGPSQTSTSDMHSRVRTHYHVCVCVSVCVLWRVAYE